MADYRLTSRTIAFFIYTFLFCVSRGGATRLPPRNFHFPPRPFFSLPSSPSLVAASPLTNHTSSTKAVSIAASTLSNVHQTARSAIAEPLTYLQTMAAGALSRSIAQTLLHPAYTYKTILQLKVADIDTIKKTLTFGRLLRGIDAQFLMSVPHGAFHFYVIDRVSFAMICHPSACRYLTYFKRKWIGKAVTCTVHESTLELPRRFHLERSFHSDLFDYLDATNGVNGPFDGGSLSQHGCRHFIYLAQ